MMSTDLHSAIIMLMLWFQRGKAQVENKTAPTGNKRQLLSFRSYLRPRRLLIVIIVLALLAVGVTWAGQWYHDYRIAKKTVYIPSEATYFANKKQALLSKPPRDSASLTDKLAYYDDLRHTYLDLGEYKLAAEAFEKRRAIAQVELYSADYIWAAEAYHKAGDNAKALQMLDTAQQNLPTGDRTADGYNKIDLVDRIAKLRKEYQS